MTNPHDPTDPWARALRTAMSPARTLEPTELEVQQALAAARPRETRQRRLMPRLAVATVAAALLGSSLYAVPATRAAVGDAYGTLSGWVSGDDDAPGKAIPAGDQTPEWVSELAGQKRLIASKEGASVYAIRDGDQLTIAFGAGTGLGTTTERWRERFGNDRVVMLGLGSFPDGKTTAPLDDRGRRALMGLTAKNVTRVQLAYTSGAPTAAQSPDGGFVLLADATRRPTTLTAYDAAGEAIETRDASNLDLRVCTDERGCPPGTPKPNITYDPPIDPSAPFFPTIR
jgi:hypothetical protein